MAGIQRRETIKDDVTESQMTDLTQFVDMYFTSTKLRRVSENSYRMFASENVTTFHGHNWLMITKQLSRLL